ncbi:hypothetical protein ASF44_23740 [Pseudorhodoferax sp. Leaf274]|nr:hypothetical protein ASF44_23740 [Pseudorhodoferax sp. Leaf274]
MALCAACGIGQAQASVATFDDVTAAAQAFVPAGYGGLNWFNVAVQDTAANGRGGFARAATSGSYVAFNNNGTAAMVSGMALPAGGAGDFLFNSVALTAVYLDGLRIHVTGLRDGAVLYEQTVLADTTGPAVFRFGWEVDALYFAADGGVPAGYGVDAPYFAMDDLRINEIPEPGTLALLGLGLGGALWSRRRRGG